MSQEQKQPVFFDLTLTVGRPNLILEYDYKIVGECLLKLGKKFAFQLEEGHEKKIKHFQIRLNAYKKTTVSAFLKLCFTVFKLENEYKSLLDVSPTSKNCHTTSNFNYILKEDTKIAGPWTEANFKPKELEFTYIPLRYRNEISLKPFQTEIMKPYINNDRIVNYIYDEEGNHGKTFITHYARFHKNGVVIPCIKDSKEILQMAYGICSSRNLRDEIKMFIDVPRTVSSENVNEFLTSCEILKAGWLYDPRNKMKDWDIEPPEIYVFSNLKPNKKMMKNNRWKFLIINEKNEFEEYKEEEDNKPVKIEVSFGSSEIPYLQPWEKLKKKNTLDL